MFQCNRRGFLSHRSPVRRLTKLLSITGQLNYLRYLSSRVTSKDLELVDALPYLYVLLLSDGASPTTVVAAIVVESNIP